MNCYRPFKKIIEPVIALMYIIILSPLFLIISILIKKDSKGSVIFKQKRIGHNQKIFSIYKFRTMVENAEKLKEKYKHLDSTDGPVFKIGNDPRFTKIGKILAKTSLDELPQLINILKGDMRFVGFRPPLPDEVAQYKEWQLKRFEGYPGLTSLWVIKGMHQIKFDDWIKIDIDYNDNESLLLDLKIVWKTGWKVVKGIKKI
jgi:lipopolysaccharide/colanic/teichoic acid biosynthesis glycosyltransferase